MIEQDMDRVQWLYLVWVYLESLGYFLFQLNDYFTARSVTAHGKTFVSS